MSLSTRIADAICSRWNVIFWLIFGIAAAVFITETILGTLTLDIITGLLILSVGTYIIGDEIRDRKRQTETTQLKTHINEILQWAEKMYDYTRSFKEKHENRIFRLDSRIGNIEKSAGISYNKNSIQQDIEFLAKKMLDIENKLNKIIRKERDKKAIEHSYSLVKPIRERELAAKKPKERSLALGDLNPRQSSSIDIIRKKGKITNREYSETYKVTTKTAYRDLAQMVSAGLLKKHGKGRSTYYTLAF